MATKGRMATPQELSKAFEEFKKIFRNPEMLAVLKRLADK